MPGVPFEEMFNWVEKTNLELWNWDLPRRKILSLPTNSTAQEKTGKN